MWDRYAGGSATILQPPAHSAGTFEAVTAPHQALMSASGPKTDGVPRDDCRLSLDKQTCSLALSPFSLSLRGIKWAHLVRYGSKCFAHQFSSRMLGQCEAHSDDVSL